MEMAEGAGAEDEDLHIFVTIEDSVVFWQILACFCLKRYFRSVERGKWMEMAVYFPL